MIEHLPAIFQRTARRVQAGLSWYERWKGRAGRPSWMSSQDDLRGVPGTYPELLRRGSVECGRLLMANSQIFQRGTDDLPGFILHSPSAPPVAFMRAIRLLEELEDLPPQKNAAVERIAAMVRDGMSRSRLVPLPKEIALGQPMRLSVVLFHRKHLPGSVLSCSWFPVLTHPDIDAAMILPYFSWAEDLKRAAADLT